MSTPTAASRSRAWGTRSNPVRPRGSARRSPIVVEQYWQPWADLLHSLRNGEPAFEHVFGTDVWAWRNENFRGGDIFAAYLAGETCLLYTSDAADERSSVD